MQILQRAEKVMSAFIGRNFFLRSILSTSDQKSFDDLEKDIKDCMQVWRCGIYTFPHFTPFLTLTRKTHRPIPHHNRTLAGDHLQFCF